MKPVKVYSCAKRFQADMIIEALKSEGIPAYSQSDGSGEYMEIYMGTSLFGENIYVDENDARRAEEIIRGITLPADDSEDLSDSSAIPDAAKDRRMPIVRIISLIAAILFIIGVVAPVIADIIP
ncbi:MAG TPA: DUF2007 domain-containing protein [Candidatus Mediterraneibacter caccogallinarum]|nr:DUF2007 domain-containing protein [Candidatus Mediterraneibacter caccogallinarum]